MECLYYNDFIEADNTIVINGEGMNHVKALHLKLNEKILITNGEGLTVLTYMMSFSITEAIFRILEHYYNLNENKHKTSLALGILDNRDRFEFAVEKTIELGVNRIIPIISEYSQRRTIKLERLNQKAISALIQSKRSVLPEITDPINLKKLTETFDYYESVFLFEESGTKLNYITEGNHLMIIGPEGGFSANEIEFLTKSSKVKIYSLGSKRLRSETAAICAMNIINYFGS